MKTVRFFILFLGMACLGFAAQAGSKDEINAEVRHAVTNFYSDTSAGKELAGKATGMLVFPNVNKSRIGIGGEFGDGALRVGGGDAGAKRLAASAHGAVGALHPELI